MELYQIYLVIGLAMGVTMLFETNLLYERAKEASAEFGIPVVVVVLIYSTVILCVGLIAWPIVLYKEIQWSSKR